MNPHYNTSGVLPGWKTREIASLSAFIVYQRWQVKE